MLPLRLRALTVSKDGRGSCLDLRRGRLRQFGTALSGAGIANNGNRRERGVEKEKEKEKEPAKGLPLARRVKARIGGREGDPCTGAGQACCSSVPWRLIYSYDPPTRGQAGSATRVAASSVNKGRIGPLKILKWRFCPAPGICRSCCDTPVVLPTGTGHRSLRSSPFEDEGCKREVTV